MENVYPYTYVVCTPRYIICRLHTLAHIWEEHSVTYYYRNQTLLDKLEVRHEIQTVENKKWKFKLNIKESDNSNFVFLIIL